MENATTIMNINRQNLLLLGNLTRKFLHIQSLLSDKNNGNLDVEKYSVSTQSIHTNPPSVRNQSTQILRQYAINPHKSSVSTLSIHTNTSSQPIPSDGQSHCLPPLHTSTLTAISLTSNIHGLPFSCLHHVTSSPTAHFTYCHHMQRNKRTSGLLKSFTVHVLYRHFYWLSCFNHSALTQSVLEQWSHVKWTPSLCWDNVRCYCSLLNVLTPCVGLNFEG